MPPQTCPSQHSSAPIPVLSGSQIILMSQRQWKQSPPLTVLTSEKGRWGVKCEAVRSQHRPRRPEGQRACHSHLHCGQQVAEDRGGPGARPRRRLRALSVMPAKGPAGRFPLLTTEHAFRQAPRQQLRVPGAPEREPGPLTSRAGSAVRAPGPAFAPDSGAFPLPQLHGPTGPATCPVQVIKPDPLPSGSHSATPTSHGMRWAGHCPVPKPTSSQLQYKDITAPRDQARGPPGTKRTLSGAGEPAGAGQG